MYYKLYIRDTNYYKYCLVFNTPTYFLIYFRVTYLFTAVK